MFKLAPIRMFLPFLALLGMVASSAFSYFQGFYQNKHTGFELHASHHNSWLELGLFIEELESEKSDESESIGKTLLCFASGIKTFFSFPPYPLEGVHANSLQIAFLHNFQGLYKSLGVFRI